MAGSDGARDGQGARQQEVIFIQKRKKKNRGGKRGKKCRKDAECVCASAARGPASRCDI